MEHQDGKPNAKASLRSFWDELIQAFVELTNDAIFVINQMGRIMHVSPSACQMLGFSEKEILNLSWHDLLPIGLPNNDPLQFENLSEDSIVHQRCFLRHKEKNSIPVHVNLRQISDGTRLIMAHEAQGSPMEVIGVNDNTVATQRAEESSQISSEQLNLALTAAQMGIWEWDLETNDIFWSPECLKFVGLESINMIFQSFKNLIHPDDAMRVQRMIEKALAERTVYTAEFRIIWSDGRVRWLSNYGKVLCDEAGKPLRMVGTVQDVTERKQAEEALRESEARYRSLFATSLDAVLLTVPDGQIVAES